MIGDVHLGAGGLGLPGFLASLRERPCARLVILGDLFDYWLDSDHCVRDHAVVLEHLQALAGNGWHIDFVIGNREMAAGRRLAIATASHLHWPSLELRLGPRALRIVHGDRLCRDPGYHLLFATMRAFWTTALRLALPEALLARCARHMRRRSRIRALSARRQLGAQPLRLSAARLRAAARGVDTVIAGHIHQAWRRTVAGVDLMLVGHWPSSEGQWVEGYADGRLVARRAAFAAGDAN